ncbi:MAG: DUF1501 domain-containing protein [Arenicella sp.]|nr:DUF1501 domain-containing protein [Arenicella sp.]
MSDCNFNRRQFLQSAFYASLLYGAGGLSRLATPTYAAPAPLQNRLLVDLFLDGGPDFRHLVVPAYSAQPGSFGNAYWTNRTRSHSLTQSGQTVEQRWNEDYYPITVGGTNWNADLVDAGGLNTGITFGIWREAGWLIDMFNAGNVAMIFNAVGGTNRAHDLSSLMMKQGNLLSSLNDQDRSGWGGRLARSAGGNSISLNSTPSPFNFGPVGIAPGYNPDAINNYDLISVENAREIGLFDFNPEADQLTNQDDKMARAAKSYYAGLRKELVAVAYQKALDHESKVREFGDLIRARLETVPIPPLIEALYSNNVQGINPDPNSGAFRRVLRRTSLGIYIRNCYDVLAANDLLNPAVMSMSYGGWDTHGDQRQIPAELATDPNNPYVYRGIESGLRDIFEGQFGANPFNASALHGGFSALWASLADQADRDKLVVTIAGEFGRQIRDNGDAGTDHGKGNLMFVISERCQGGVYGEIFQQAEIPKYDLPVNQTPDIEPRTEIDQIFSKVSDWVAPGSGTSVFPRMSPNYIGDAPTIELPGMFDNLLV